MKKFAAALMIGVAMLATPALANDVQVVANSSVAADLSAADLKEIFLGNKTSVGGAAVEPVLANGGSAHEAFLRQYVGKSDQGLRTHFKSLVFTGKASMPKSFASDAEVIKYVSTTKGAIGYVSGAADVAGVKKVTVK